MALEPLTQGIWTAPMPHTFLGLRFGTRMTVVRLSDGSLFVHSPIALDGALKTELDALGPVAHIVAPNLYHHLFVGDFAASYPEAKTHGPPGLEKKRSDLAFNATLGERPDPSWSDDLTAIPIDGTSIEETVFFHRPSSTLITADLVQNYETSDHWATRWYLKASNIHGKPGLSKLLRMAFRDKTKARRAIDQAIDSNPERITVTHGEPILANGREALRNAYEWLVP